MIFNTLGPKNQGSRLGVYSALVGIGTMLGSFVSGYLSFYVGFTSTFVFAAAGLVACALLIPTIFSSTHPEKKEHVTAMLT
jgi:predicted MFS family arabinose efflux permease